MRHTSAKFLPWLCAVAIVAGATVFSAGPAFAILTLRLTEFSGSGTTLTCADDDGTGCDSTPGLGLSFSGTVGAFEVDIVAALAKGPARAALSLSTGAVATGGAGGFLVVEASDNDYTLGIPGTETPTFQSTISGAIDGAPLSFVLPLQCVGLNNVLFTDCDVALLHGPFSTPTSATFSDQKSMSVLPTGPFALTEQLFIGLFGPGQVTVNFDSQVAVSEPSVVLLLGTGLTVLSVIPRRIRRRNAKPGGPDA